MLALEDKPAAESSCPEAVGNIVQEDCSEAVEWQPKDDDIFEDDCSEAVESQPKDDNIVEEDGINETTPKDGKANAASSPSSSSSSSSSSSDQSTRRKLELQTALTHLKSLEEVHHLEGTGCCLRMIKSAMKNINAALHM